MGGWFRKEIKSIADLQGLKMRIAGMGGQIMAKLGVVPQVLAAGDIYPALERGTLDAVEFSGPHDDEKLGFVKVAQYYYYPGFWEGGAQPSLYVNMNKWNELPANYKAILEAACAEANAMCVAKYDAQNADAIRRLAGQGVQLRPFPRDVMEQSYKEAYKLYGEIAASNAKFKKVYRFLERFPREGADLVPHRRAALRLFRQSAAGPAPLKHPKSSRRRRKAPFSFAREKDRSLT